MVKPKKYKSKVTKGKIKLPKDFNGLIGINYPYPTFTIQGEFIYFTQTEGQTIEIIYRPIDLIKIERAIKFINEKINLEEITKSHKHAKYICLKAIRTADIDCFEDKSPDSEFKTKHNKFCYKIDRYFEALAKTFKD